MSSALNRISIALVAVSVVTFSFKLAPHSLAADKPNFIIVFVDDLGYGDLACYGNTKIKTPRIDRMAREGMRLTSFYAQTVCGPSRAALMTGCYPLRVAKHKEPNAIHPYLHSSEITIAEVLHERGYVSGCFGKWDLAGHKQVGYAPELLPTQQGFSHFFGTPTSNDAFVNLLRNEEVIEKKADMGTLTRRYTDEAIKFIENNKDKPFFVYVPHTMPHTILDASKEFRGKSIRGLYGDVVEEIDANVGRIIDTLEKHDLEKNTYVIFCSDNGPWHLRGDHGGTSGQLRGAKTSTWEGGLRVPCVIWAPGRVPANKECDEIATTLDILPTLGSLAGASIPQDRIIDGHDIRDLLHGVEGVKTSTEAFYYYQHVHLQAVRSGKWKLHLPRAAEPAWCPKWGRHIDREDVFEIKEPMLFDLKTDIGEQRNVASSYPDVVKRLTKLAEAGRNDIGDYDRLGSGSRAFGDSPVRRKLWTEKK